MSDTERLAVVVVNYGTHQLVAENLPKVVAGGVARQVLVVDNFSGETERRQVQELCDARGWTLLAMDANLGFGGGVNEGVRQALASGARELLVVNPDAWLDPDTVRALQARVRADPDLLLAPVVTKPDGRLYAALAELRLRRGEMGAPDPGVPTPEPGTVRWVSGACFMVSAELWTRVGGYDEDYFLYWEDVDLSARVAQAGGRVAVADDLHAQHVEGASHDFDGGGRAKSPIYYYFNTRNRLLYAAKHVTGRDRLRWVLATPVLSYRILLQGGRRQLVRPGSTLWPALRGTLAGLLLLVTHGRRGRSSSVPVVT